MFPHHPPCAPIDTFSAIRNGGVLKIVSYASFKLNFIITLLKLTCKLKRELPEFIIQLIIVEALTPF